MKARLIQEIGTKASLRRYWGSGCQPFGYHNATKHLLNSDILQDWSLGGIVEDYPLEQWPSVCDHCGIPVPEEAIFQIKHDRLYNSESGKPEPGDLYFVTWLSPKQYWDNHDGPTLMAILPDGSQWNIDSRASNCTMPDDRIHRCWVKHGEPPNLHVDKNGNTCAAGAGSILSHSGWHGYLHNGEFVL